MNEQEQFLKGLDTDQTKTVDVLDQPIVPGTADAPAKVEPEEGIAKVDEGESDGSIKPRNRREKRLMEKLQEERESSIFLAGKLQAREEARVAVDEESDYLKSVERIYGTDTPEAQLATDLLKKAIIGSREDAKREALEEIRRERELEKEQYASATNELDGMIDDIEDTYGVTMNESHQTGFFQLLQKMSPKDREGNVYEYADPHAVWEVYQGLIQSRTTDNRAKNLSARSMVQSGASKESNLQDDSHARFLRDNGII